MAVLHPFELGRLSQRIEHEEIQPGDVIELAHEPARVVEVCPWLTGTVRVKIERPAGASLPGTIGTYYLGAPVVLLEREAVA